MANIEIIQPGQTRQRFHRRPNFPMTGTMKPMGLYPIMAHPVLPGETLKSATTKWSIVSQPIKNPLGGAWLEAWLFYVKLTDIDRELGQMFISDTFSTSGYTAGANSSLLFHANGQINWVEMCLHRIRDAFFINEGETAVFMSSPEAVIPMMKLNSRSWHQNLMFEPTEVALDTTGEMDHREQMSAWQMLQQMQMTELTYERYLEQYGVQSMSLGVGEPEILRYSRSWTKPVNTIDPLTGAPSSAWVWNDEMKTSKDKRFEEPGFVIMLAGVRPKFYNSQQIYSMIGEMWGFTDWFPAYNLTDPVAGIKRFSSINGIMDPTINEAEGEVQMLYDMRDLLSHGEQFVNDTGNNPYPHPMSTGMDWQAATDPALVRGEYPVIADINGLFVGTTQAKMRCQYEGITSLTIAGHITDTTL